MFDLTPRGILDSLDLLHPIYRATAAYGHFGRKPGEVTVGGRRVKLFTWEDPSRSSDLREAVRNVA